MEALATDRYSEGLERPDACAEMVVFKPYGKSFNVSEFQSCAKLG